MVKYTVLVLSRNILNFKLTDFIAMSADNFGKINSNNFGSLIHISNDIDAKKRMLAEKLGQVHGTREWFGRNQYYFSFVQVKINILL